MRILVSALAGLALVVSATGALACSVTEDFVRATNYELVENADAVVVAVALSEVAGEDGEPADVLFRVESAFKGTPPDRVTMGWAALGQTSRSDPDSISEAHPESFMGPCTRHTFQSGRRYVLFLEEGDGPGEGGGWRVQRSVFARSTEDYAGPDSLWARAIRTYIEIQGNSDRMAALADLAARLPALENAGASPADRALADDFRDHLSSLSPDKPTPYLIDAYEALERGESPRFSIRGPQANREGGIADAMTDMIFDVRHPEFDLVRQKQSVLRSLVNGDHPEAVGLFERLLAGHPDAATLGMTIRYLSNSGQLRRAFELAETEGMRRLGGLPRQDASALVGDIADAMRGKDWDYEADNEAWRSDPYVAARWPEMALGLYWLDQRLGFGGYSFQAEMKAIRPANPRARPEVTLALADRHDEAVQAWAITESDRLVPEADWLKDEDPAWLPVRALVVAFGEERDAALLRAYCRGEAGRIMVVQTLGLWGDELDEEMLKRMLITRGQDEESLDGVRKALAMLYGRHASDREGLFSNDGGYEAIKSSLTGETVDHYGEALQPIDCPRS